MRTTIFVIVILFCSLHLHAQRQMDQKMIEEIKSKTKELIPKANERFVALTPKTKIEIDANGMIVNVKITRSSGSAKLDEAVENMIYSSAPYPDLPFQLLNESKTLTFMRVWEFYGD